MKFGQLIECNMRNIFLKSAFTKYGRETSLRPFSKISKTSISLDEILHSLFLFQELPKYIKTKVLAFCFFLIISFL